MERKSHNVNEVVLVESILPDLKKWGNEPFSLTIQKRDLEQTDQPVLRKTKVCGMLKKQWG